MSWTKSLIGSREKIVDMLWRLPLALVFLYAAWEKIADPESFAQTIANYRLFPGWSIGPLALILPFVELWAALLLFTGKWRKASALILALLLISFITAVGFNLGRGLDFDCGCFGPSGRRAGIKLLVQDGLLLFCALMVFFKRDRATASA